jgi:hypothetical protein
MTSLFEPDRFYEHEPTEGIFCGECVKKAVDKTAEGEYTGIEASYSHEYRLLQDDDTEPYQCDGCNKQNDAYEEFDWEE